MNKLLKADLYKLSKSAAIRISFVISLFSITLLAVVLYNVSHGNIGSEIMGSVSILADAMMISLLSSLMTGIIICGDFQSKNIHAEIASGGRRTVVITKMFTNLLITTILILPYAAIAIIAFSSKVNFAVLKGIPSMFINVMTNEAGVTVDGSSIGKSIVICLIGILIYMARLSICVPVAFLVRKPVAVMAVGIVSAFGFDMIVRSAKDVYILGDLLAYTPYAIIYDLNMNVGSDVMLKAVVSSLIFILLMTALTYSLFRKSEIK